MARKMQRLTFNQVLAVGKREVKFSNRQLLYSLPVFLLNVEGNTVDLVPIQCEEVDPLLLNLESLISVLNESSNASEILPRDRLGGRPT